MQVRQQLLGNRNSDVREAPFASPEDHEICRKLHRAHGSTYYLSSRLFPRQVRRRTDVLYGFVRVADEWVDNPGDLTPQQQAALLADFREQLLMGVDGVRPEHPAMRAFCDLCREIRMPLQEPLLFLDAMSQDLTVERYDTYGNLCRYMRGSASSVGLMMCTIMGVHRDHHCLSSARSLGEAMQLTNFLRDVGEDAVRGRIYLPLEDMERFGVSEEDILQGRVTEGFRNLMRFEIERARTGYIIADQGIHELPPACRAPVRLARLLYSRILDQIEKNGYDVFNKRARTSAFEKAIIVSRVLIRG